MSLLPKKEMKPVLKNHHFLRQDIHFQQFNCIKINLLCIDCELIWIDVIENNISDRSKINNLKTSCLFILLITIKQMILEQWVSIDCFFVCTCDMMKMNTSERSHHMWDSFCCQIEFRCTSLERE